MILYSVAFNLSINKYYYSNLSSHSSLARMSYLSEMSYSLKTTVTIVFPCVYTNPRNSVIKDTVITIKSNRIHKNNLPNYFWED